MPKLLFARPPVDAVEERRIRKLAGARHAPADWIRRAQMITMSWDGLRVPGIAAALGCSPKAVRDRLARFAAEGLNGLGDRPGAGRTPRIRQDQRSQLIALVANPPPGRGVRDDTGELTATDPAGPAVWTLDALTAPARAAGIATSPGPRCAASCSPRACAGAAPAPGRPAPIRSSSHKNAGRGLLHAPAGGHHGDCRDELAPGDAAHL